MRLLVIAATVAALAVPGVASASPSPLSFSRSIIKVGKVPLDNIFQDYDVFVTNTGSVPLTLFAWEISPNPNTYISPCNGEVIKTLTPGEDCLFEVNIGTSTPEVGNLNGKWCVTATDGNNTYRKCGHLIGKIVP